MKKFKAIGFLMLLGFLTSCGGGSDGGVSIPILGGDARLNDSAQGLMSAQLNGTFDTTPAPSVREKFISANYSLDGETKASVKPFFPAPSAAVGDATTAITIACTGTKATKNGTPVYVIDSGRAVSNGVATKTISYYDRNTTPGATPTSCPTGSPNGTSTEPSTKTLYATEKQQDTFSITSATAGALPSPLVDGSKVDVTLTYHRDDVETYTVTAGTPDLDLDGNGDVTGTTSSSSKEDGTHLFRMAFNEAANTFQLVADIPVTVTQVELTNAGQSVTATAVTLELKDVTAGGTSPSLCNPAGNVLCEGTVARSAPFAVFVNSSAAIGDIDFGGRAVASATPAADASLAGANVKISAGIAGTGTAAGLYTFTVSADNAPGTYATTRSFLMNVQ